MKRLVLFFRERSEQIQSIFKKMAIALLVYSAFRFLARNGFFESITFLENLIYSPIVEVMFLATVMIAIFFGAVKYLLLKKSFF